ncbi:MAG: 5'-methylthioadenosine/S-adenosylhomocysteine nucleosidase [Arcobacter butzleri]|jgi:nucleoside phosphorylase|nr:purine-nucleoside phosphorylase [Arcobacteraceae bacterium]MDY0365231.1 purine-nucleoside phosphorylase [Arcobacteraceae bacterium]NLO17648.1 5'-methylthioadenosine/S-adenosylhomocysteine nucleosidase [Aliarcobacter butzleri]
MIISAGKQETFSFATPIGVGMIESAINLTRIALFDKPDYLVFIGSAGSYGKYNIFDIVESSSASNIELSFWQNLSYTPIDNLLKLENIKSKSDIIVNSSNYISTSQELCQNFIKNSIDIENMEFYSVLQVAKEFNISCLGIFVITNFCNQNAHQDFIKNHPLAMDKLIEYLQKKGLITNVSRETF